jgi:hypothetical protein
MSAEFATVVLLVALPAIVGIIVRADKGRGGFAWALVALLFEVSLILLAYGGLPLATIRSHGDGALVLAALVGFIVMLAVVATLPHRGVS